MTTPGQDPNGRLLAALRPGLLRFALIQLRDPAQAEDIVQETLAAAWGKLGQFREEADLKTWVTAILKNKIADHFRSGRRTAVSLDSLREENEAADQAWHTCFDAGGHWLETAAPAAWRPPEDYAEQQDFFRTLENCLGGLPEENMFKCREACKLLSEAQDRKLTLRERVLLNFHLAVCPPCRRYRKQLAFLRENLKKWLSDKYS